MKLKKFSDTEDRARKWMSYVMKERGLRLVELAHTIGISPSALSLSFKRRSAVRWAVAERLVTVYGLDAHAVLLTDPPRWPRGAASRAAPATFGASVGPNPLRTGAEAGSGS